MFGLQRSNIYVTYCENRSSSRGKTYGQTDITIRMRVIFWHVLCGRLNEAEQRYERINDGRIVGGESE